MPYIPMESRFAAFHRPTTSGELTFQLYVNCLNYRDSKGECYTTYNTILGALEATKLELYRRHVAPYEDRKIEENGDV